ncbi:MAG: 30S ribosomal protein S4 [Tenericutes bacterium ADurb.Bin087]|nr:MAG: 30S ribosomal protein S4 [Tenericutes bacterium ADurb.Bin087]
MRDTGSVWKKSRRLSYSILETGEELRKRPYGPGQHGNNRRRKVSEYGKQLMEKQKLRLTYGVNERQFKRLFLLAKKNKDVVTGLAFIQILESRLDNLVFRLGLANTRSQARQLVSHGHIEVDGQKVDIPSFLVPVGSTISVRENSQDLKLFKFNLDKVGRTVPFVTLNAEKFSGRFDRLPERTEVAQDIQENLIIEFYNRSM